jgi:hypothetical protein
MLTCVEGTIIGFAVVDAGNQTRLTGQTSVMAGGSPSILSWSRNTSQFQAYLILLGRAVFIGIARTVVQLLVTPSHFAP